MSEPKRYGHKAIIYPISDDDTYITVPIQEADGPWVTYMDYCRLKTEVDRLTAFTTRTIIPNEELQKQVERLTKAGDAMVPLLGRGDYDIARYDWKAAKEGKQSK
jgi:hypothetical protein